MGSCCVFCATFTYLMCKVHSWRMPCMCGVLGKITMCHSSPFMFVKLLKLDFFATVMRGWRKYCVRSALLCRKYQIEEIVRNRNLCHCKTFLRVQRLSNGPTDNNHHRFSAVRLLQILSTQCSTLRLRCTCFRHRVYYRGTTCAKSALLCEKIAATCTFPAQKGLVGPKHCVGSISLCRKSKVLQQFSWKSNQFSHLLIVLWHKDSRTATVVAYFPY